MPTSHSEPADPHPGRLHAPPSYGLLAPAQGSGLLAWNWATERLTRARNYWVSTTGPGGAPHAMPIWGVWLDASLRFATDRHSRKGRNLARDPRLVVHLESGDEVVILEGSATEVADSAALRRFADAYAAKYQVQVEVSADALHTNVVLALRPRVAFAWLERDYPGSATRWQFE